MRKKRTSNVSKPKTDWDELDTLTDEQVRTGVEADPISGPVGHVPHISVLAENLAGHEAATGYGPQADKARTRRK